MRLGSGDQVMKTTNRFAIAALTTWLYALSAQAQIEANVPIARLLATPDRYDGKEISTSGVLRLSRGVTAIYTDAGSANAEVTANALVVLSSDHSLSENDVKAANGQYVLVLGRFSSSSPQPRGYSGIIENVNALRAYPLMKELPAGRAKHQRRHPPTSSTSTTANLLTTARGELRNFSATRFQSTRLREHP